MGSTSNVFLSFATKLNLNTQEDVNKIKDLILDNINAIGENALTENCIDRDKMDLVKPLSLNLTTLRFVPQNTGYVYQWTPSFIASRFGWCCSDDAKHISDFFDFLTSYAPELTQLKVRNEDFIPYLHNKYKTLDWGLVYLGEAYHRSKRTLDHQIVNASQVALTRFDTCCCLLGNISSENYSLHKAMKILEIERYSALESVINVRKYRCAKSEVEEKLEDKQITFLACCIRMKDLELKDFCEKFEKILSTLDADLIYSVLLKNERFSSMHLWLVSKILKPRQFESQEEFDKRTAGEPVKQALKYVEDTIIELKSALMPLDKLMRLSKFLRDHSGIEHYKPFQHILNFVFDHYKTPKIAGYPGLPLHITGDNDFNQFIANVWLKNKDFYNIDMTTHEGRMILLTSAEFLFADRKIDVKRLKEWQSFCAKELPEFSKIQAFLSS